jgi:hypothetical protein
MSNMFEDLVKLFHLNPILFTLSLLAAVLILPYQIVYHPGPTKPHHYGYNNPRQKLIIYFSFLAVELVIVAYSAWRVRNW